MAADQHSYPGPAAPPPSAPELRASAFPDGTPLNAFFAWNEARAFFAWNEARAFFAWNKARRATDRRYRVARDLHQLRQGWGDDVCLAHLTGQPLGLRQVGARIVASAQAAARARQLVAGAAGVSAVIAAQRVVGALQSAIGSPDAARHAAVFRAFEELAVHVDLDALARLRPQPRGARPVRGPRRILIIKLGALGDFVQALGPAPEIRRHHGDDHLALLTTGRYAEIARQTGLFDAILIDRRPRPFDLCGWLALRHMLRGGHFDRVYDFQTSDRSNFYFRLLRPGRRTEWSGTAWRCSHPHANLERDRQHTMDRQAEQL
ncbi:MAG: glycosyltransferase family 9 protein, partial [Stellaceae bacterium]